MAYFLISLCCTAKDIPIKQQAVHGFYEESPIFRMLSMQSSISVRHTKNYVTSWSKRSILFHPRTDMNGKMHHRAIWWRPVS
nr:putative integron gene cassette protein [uncultured bacterium]